VTNPTPPTSPTVGLLRIQEVAAQIGATTRSIRYWEEQGLLRPAARSHGDYRLYDETDIERLRFIKALRDDAGFSLAEVAQLLENEAARERGHAAYRATTDPTERLRILHDRVERYQNQIALLSTKIERLRAMVEDTQARLDRTRRAMADLAQEQASATPADATR